MRDEIVAYVHRGLVWVEKNGEHVLSAQMSEQHGPKEWRAVAEYLKAEGYDIESWDWDREDGIRAGWWAELSPAA